MWALRLLTGPQAGHVFPLKNGTSTVGRAPHCEVKLPSTGVSKEHAKIDVLEGKTVLTDLGSRNGTFVNGVQVKSIKIKAGDKIAFHDMILEIHQLTQSQLAQYQAFAARMHQQKHAGANPSHHQQPSYQGNVAFQPQSPPPAQGFSPAPAGFEMSAANPSSAAPSSLPKVEFLNWLKNYVETVVLPGAYRLPELVEFRLVLMGFMAAFIFFTTSLSSIPLMTILKSSIEKESQRRALTIARTLAQINRPALMQGLESSVTIDIAAREPGVEKALIISHVDGNVIAPASLAGTYPDLPFIHTARRLGKESVEQINSNRIGALVPIEFFNAETGANQTAAYAVVIYDMGTLAVDDGRTLSLFIQTFAIALIIGGLLFFFMYKIIEFPLIRLNSQLDVALREGQSDVQTTYLFPALVNLTSNINSALSRVGSSSSATQNQQERDRHTEMTNIVELMGFGALAVNGNDMTIASVNPAFEQRTGMASSQLVHNTVDKITDQALKLSLQDLIERLNLSPDQMATNDLEFSGQNFQIAGQAVYGNQRVAYFLFVLLPAEGG